MEELLSFVSLGSGHVLDPGGIDHLLFLLVLAAGYRARDWRHAVAIVSAFTIGHSLTLGLSVTDLMRIPPNLVEFFIPVTIVLAGIETVARGGRQDSGWRRPMLAGSFGLVHGAGFANYLRGLFDDRVAMPLLGFNLGIELAQVLVLLIAAGAFAAADRMIALFSADRSSARAFRVRAVGISVALVLAAAAMAAQRAPWR